MKRLLTLTLFSLLAISCSGNQGYTPTSKDSSMTNTVGTQAELDTANQRMNDYRQELLRQGFHEISASSTNTTGVISNSKEEHILEGRYRNLKDLRVTLWTTTRLQKDQQPHLGGGVQAFIISEQADQDFEELYKKVSFVVTGHAE